MTEQERAAALAKRIDDAKSTMLQLLVTDGSREDILAEYYWSIVEHEDIDLVVSALRAYARPAPADLREAATNAAYDATRLEDGTPQFAAAGFCLGHAAKMADAILALLPQTQDMDDAASFDARVNAAESILRSGED